MVEDFRQTTVQLGTIAGAIRNLRESNQSIHGEVEEIRNLALDISGQGPPVRGFAKTLRGSTEDLQATLADFRTGDSMFDKLHDACLSFRDRTAAIVQRLADQGANIFDQAYKEIPGSNPKRYTTSYDNRCDADMTRVNDDLLGTARPRRPGPRQQQLRPGPQQRLLQPAHGRPHRRPRQMPPQAHLQRPGGIRCARTRSRRSSRPTSATPAKSFPTSPCPSSSAAAIGVACASASSRNWSSRDDRRLWGRDVLAYWFGPPTIPITVSPAPPGSARMPPSTPDIRSRFRALHQWAASGLPRRLGRGTGADAGAGHRPRPVFPPDLSRPAPGLQERRQALHLAERAVAAGFDRQLPALQRAFLYFPSNTPNRRRPRKNP